MLNRWLTRGNAEQMIDTWQCTIGSRHMSIQNRIPAHDNTVYSSLPAHDNTVYSSLSAHDNTVYCSLPAHDNTVYSSLPAHDNTVSSSLSAHDNAKQVTKAWQYSIGNYQCMTMQNRLPASWQCKIGHQHNNAKQVCLKLWIRCSCFVVVVRTFSEAPRKVQTWANCGYWEL